MTDNLTHAEAVATGKPIALPKTDYFTAGFYTGAEWVGERPKGAVLLGATHSAIQRGRPVDPDEEPAAYVHYFYLRRERCFKPVYARHPDEVDPQRLSRCETSLYIRALLDLGRGFGETELERRARLIRHDLEYAESELRRQINESYTIESAKHNRVRRNAAAERINRARELRDELYADLIVAEQKLLEEAQACRTTG